MRTSLPEPRLVILALALAAGPASAQRYLVHGYTENDGLPSSTIHSVLQDPEGLLWIATRAGVVSWDGSTWNRHGVGEGLLEADQSDLALDPSGKIWTVAHRTPIRVAFRDGDAWRQVPTPLDETGLHVTGFAVARGSDADRAIVLLSSGELWSLHGDAWARVPLDAHGRAVVASGDTAFVGTDAGLRIVDLRTGSAAPSALELPESPVFALHRDPDGALWLVGDSWIGRAADDGCRIVWQGEGFGFPEQWGPVVTEHDGAGGLFFGNAVRLLHWSPGRAPEPLGLANGLLAEGTTSLLLDAENDLWVGSLRGLSKVVSFRFANRDHEHGLQDDEVTAVLRRRSGEIVLGHPLGLTFLDDPPRAMPLPGAAIEDRVLDLAEGSDGTLWIAAHMHGLVEMAPDGRMTDHPSPGGANMPVMSVLMDRGGRLWLGSGGRQPVFRGDGRRFENVPLPLPPGLRVYVRRIVEGRDGAVWIATHGAGVFRILGDTAERWTTGGAEDPERASSSTYAVLDRDDGTVWVGTLDGLYRGENGVLTKETAPRIDRPVYLAFRDAQGHAWFGTDNGVFRWDGRSLRHFTVSDGLIGREINRAAGLAMPDGSVWIGTSRGLSVYRPELDLPRPRGPIVELLGLDVNGTVHPAAEETRLTASSGTLLFTLRALSFVDETRVRFRTRLDGFDPGWSAPDLLPQRSVRYTNVPPGEYRMQVQAVDAEGAVSDVASSGPIVIRPPLLERPLVRSLALAAALGVVLMLLAYVAQRRHARHLERVVRERTDELRRTERDLAKAHRLEALGVLAGGIAHDFNNLLQVMMGGAALLEADSRVPADRRQVAHEVKTAGRHARDLTSQLLTFSRGGAPARRATVLAPVIRDAMAFALRGSRVRGELDLDDETLTVVGDGSQIYQMLHNLLLNARQAMPEGGEVRVRARREEGDDARILLEIRDSGPGVPEENRERIFDPFFSTKNDGTGLGLSVAHSIVERHGGSIELECPPGRGAIFRVRLPAGNPADVRVDPDGPARPASPSPGRVLIMDDDAAVRRSLARMLSELGYRTSTARDGGEAVSLYRETLARGETFDAVLMDLQIAGGVGGRDALRALIGLDPDVRAIVVSGYSDDPVMARHREMGFRACLAKPFTPDDLRRVIGEVAGVVPGRARLS